MVDAGAIDKTVFDFLVSSGKLDSKKVRVFFTSKPYVDYVFAAGKDVPGAKRKVRPRPPDLEDGQRGSYPEDPPRQTFRSCERPRTRAMRRIAHELEIF